MPAFFDIANLEVSLGQVRILQGLNLSFRQGDVTALLGHNGSGKSTLLKVLGRHQRPAAGTIQLQSQPLDQLSARHFARIVGYLPQHPPATDGLTALELIKFGRYPWHGALGRFSREDREQVERALALTDTEGFADRNVDELSGGERQRVWLAMLLAQNSQFLLLDEPLAALDIAHQIEVLELIRRLSRELGLGIMLVLHDINLAARYCDRLVALHGGRAIAAGTPGDIMSPGCLRAIYGVDVSMVAHPVLGIPVALVN